MAHKRIEDGIGGKGARTVGLWAAQVIFGHRWRFLDKADDAPNADTVVAFGCERALDGTILEANAAREHMYPLAFARCGPLLVAQLVCTLLIGSRDAAPVLTGVFDRNGLLRRIDFRWGRHAVESEDAADLDEVVLIDSSPQLQWRVVRSIPRAPLVMTAKRIFVAIITFRATKHRRRMPHIGGTLTRIKMAHRGAFADEEFDAALANQINSFILWPPM